MFKKLLVLAVVMLGMAAINGTASAGVFFQRSVTRTFTRTPVFARQQVFVQPNVVVNGFGHAPVFVPNRVFGANAFFFNGGAVSGFNTFGTAVVPFGGCFH